jgi:hypothetical protein
MVGQGIAIGGYQLLNFNSMGFSGAGAGAGAGSGVGAGVGAGAGSAQPIIVKIHTTSMTSRINNFFIFNLLA